MNDFSQNAFVRWASKAMFFLLLSILWMVCCLPVVTIIPACVALYDTAVQCLHGDDDQIVRTFFTSFKEALLRRIGLSVFWVMLSGVLLVSYWFLGVMSQGNSLLQIYSMVYAGTMLIPLAALAWVIPLETRQRLGFMQLHKTALVYSFIHLPTTGALLAIVAIGLVLLLTLPVLIVLLPAVIATVQSWLTEKALDKHEAQ